MYRKNTVGESLVLSLVLDIHWGSWNISPRDKGVNCIYINDEPKSTIYFVLGLSINLRFWLKGELKAQVVQKTILNKDYLQCIKCRLPPLPVPNLHANSYFFK